MADGENKIIKWIKKWQKGKGDIRTGEENTQITGPEENLREAADKGDIRAEENPQITGPEENLREAEENLREAEKNLREAEKNFREEATKVDEDEKSGDTMPPENIVKHEPTAVKRNKDSPEIIEKRKVGIKILAGKPIVITLIIVAIVLGGFLLYTLIQYSNQSYKIENFNALWNQSLSDLRNGNISVIEYCNERVHDENLCNQFNNLQYMN
ncbi:MAG: hypothetical protein QOK56_08415 [Nitrososphaeraceae archaeon]|nr:hypothetical protein [Nitrososphaeraceae archaeon]